MTSLVLLSSFYIRENLGKSLILFKLENHFCDDARFSRKILKSISVTML